MVRRDRDDGERHVYVRFTLTSSQRDELDRAAHRADRTRASHIRAILVAAGAITRAEPRYKLPDDDIEEGARVSLT